MVRTSISVLAFCSVMAATAAQAKFVNVPLPPVRSEAPISQEAPLAVVQAEDAAMPGKSANAITQNRNSRSQPVDASKR